MTEPSRPISSFDPEVFWALHKQKIVLSAALGILILVCGSAYVGLQYVQSQQAEKAYSAAESIEAWRTLIRQFPDSVAAGNSYLRIAAKLAQDGKYPESDTNYETFIRQFPKHPLLANGYMGLAINAEQERNPDKALEYYRKIVTLFGTSFQAPMALYHEARIAAQKGQLKEAQALYESIIQRFPESTAAGIASREAGILADKLSAQQKPAPVAKLGASATPSGSGSGTPATGASATPTGSGSAIPGTGASSATPSGSASPTENTSSKPEP
jgi:tetratricopeptide (TPR) repeat protein